MTLGLGRSVRRRPASDEATAVTRLVMGLSLAVGGMAALIGVTAREPMALLALPTLTVAIALVVERPVVAAWSAAAVWATLLPAAHGEAMIGPLAMIVICAAIAVGPDRFADLVERDLLGQRRDADAESRDGIEDL